MSRVHTKDSLYPKAEILVESKDHTSPWGQAERSQKGSGLLGASPWKALLLINMHVMSFNEERSVLSPTGV